MLVFHLAQNKVIFYSNQTIPQIRQYSLQSKQKSILNPKLALILEVLWKLSKKDQIFKFQNVCNLATIKKVEVQNFLTQLYPTSFKCSLPMCLFWIFFTTTAQLEISQCLWDAKQPRWQVLITISECHSGEPHSNTRVVFRTQCSNYWVTKTAACNDITQYLISHYKILMIEI